MSTEADTCRKYVVPKLQAADWETEPHSITEQKTFTDGRVMITGNFTRRGKKKRPDYLLRYTRDFMIAVVEAKAEYLTPSQGLQQAKEYAESLGLKFAYATNGHGIVEYDFLTGLESELDTFPTPHELWKRLCENEGISSEEIVDKLLTPFNLVSGKQPRYYQEIAINRVVQSVLQGKPRLLLTMATGTGKTLIAFQICWKLWNSRWNRTGEHRRPRILFLADRNILVNDPKDKIFSIFGDARWKIENGVANKSRELYFAIYQALAKDENRPGLYKEFSPDFFDLIIVDECHRGSANEKGNWREILEYFAPAYQLGLTATPLREENKDTYQYFGNPLYQYSLKQGIQDGFLAPYRVHRVVTTFDATGWRPSAGELDRYKRVIPDEQYETKDFERVVSLRARTKAIAKHLAGFMQKNGRFDKTIVFCVDQEHADEMRRELNNLNTDLTRQYSNYVCRVTSDEGDVGRGYLSKFQDIETTTPVILTTSQLLTTGVDAETCKNVVLVRVINSMTEFKQIIGRGTRLREDYGKLFFNIIDYTGSATRLFADSDFDGFPALLTEVSIDETGNTIEGTEIIIEPELEPADEPIENIPTGQDSIKKNKLPIPRKFYFDGGAAEIAADMVHELDADGKQLRVIKYTDFTAEKVRILYPSADVMRKRWGNTEQRAEIIEMLEERGISIDELAQQMKHPEADPFDLLCHLAFNAPLLTRRQRAEKLRKEKKDFFDQFGAEARAILDEVLNKYAEHGITEFVIPDTLKNAPISDYGNVIEIANYFGGANQLRNAVNEMQNLLYAA